MQFKLGLQRTRQYLRLTLETEQLHTFRPLVTMGGNFMLAQIDFALPRLHGHAQVLEKQ